MLSSSEHSMWTFERVLAPFDDVACMVGALAGETVLSCMVNDDSFGRPSVGQLSTLLADSGDVNICNT